MVNEPIGNNGLGILLCGRILPWGPSFKVKRWFTGFSELSFLWIQICIGSPMRRSSFGLALKTKWLPDHIFYVKWGGGGIQKIPNISLIFGHRGLEQESSYIH